MRPTQRGALLSDLQIDADSVVTIHYTLKNDEGQILDSSDGRSPLAYLHGHSNIVPGLENALVGQKVGAKMNISVPPAEGYGERTGPGPQQVKKKEFGKDADKLAEGMPISAEASDGTRVTLWITKVEGSWVHVDTNHPLAGQTLNFDVEIVDIRAASAEELSHGHVHGPHGHNH